MKLTMRKIFTLSIILFSCANLFAQKNNQEFRATWVITWEHIYSSNTAEQNKARVREILDNHQKANMTSVLWQARQSGTAYYNSAFEPWGSYAGSTYPGYDPLEYAIEEAHKRGLELHAWFNVFSVASTASGTVADKHPEWICRDQDGNPMTAYRAASPGLEAVRDYTVNVAMEIVKKYDIDGLHLDYVRWNEYDTDDMITPLSPLEQESQLDGMISEEKFNKLSKTAAASRFIYDIEHPYSGGVPAGFSTWDDWRRWSVTEFVKTLHDSIQAVKPWVRLTPAALGKYRLGGVNGWNGYYVVFQDAALWFNEGYVDQLTPMHYHWLSGNSLYDHISSDWEPYIQKGINDGRLYSVGPGSYRLADENIWSNHEGIVSRLRDKSWVDGYQFFSYGQWRSYDYWEEAADKFFNSKTKVRSAYFVEQPLPPLFYLSKIDSLRYDLNVNPTDAQTENQWSAVYRSEDDNFDVSNDKIIDIHFGNEFYIVHEVFDGLQNFNSTYKYFVTTLNRFWNESEISNVVITGNIPSFAPEIIATTPLQNDVINISDKIEIQFSKSMNKESFADAVTITPSVQIISLNWSNKERHLIINTSNFTYATEYTLRIDSTVTDVNGRGIDSDKDGFTDTSFTMKFITSEKDIFPPQIVYSNPLDNDTHIDAASIITVVFDEKLNPNSVNSNALTLSNEFHTIEFNYLLSSAIDGRSILCVQPKVIFEPSRMYTLKLGAGIADTLGNFIGHDKFISFTTSKYEYDEIKMIDNFTNPGDWQQPSYSGSTKGILEAGTHFEFTDIIYLPSISSRKAAKLSYLWDESATTHMIREYLKGGTPQTTYFDTSYVLQSYVYGDGSNNQLRFCIDEYTGSAWGDHEVSQWTTIDWLGWKLVEWQLNDPGSVGSWIGDEKLTGVYYRIDSYQLTKTQDGSAAGVIYFDELRAVKKSFDVTDIDEAENSHLTSFTLEQNYPNPFNPRTVIKFQVPSSKFVKLQVFDLLGREIQTLVNEQKPAGNYEVVFDGSGLASGFYIYKLQSGGATLSRKMLLLK